MLIERIYDFSPIFLQNIMCSIKGYQQESERYGGRYRYYRKYFKDFDSLSFDEKKKEQIKKLKELLEYAVTYSTFYANLYKDIDVSQISSIEDLKILPIIDKEMLRNNIEEIMTVSLKDASVSHTGGTTGKSLTVRFTKDDMRQRMALLDNFKARVGFENMEMKRATFNGKHIVPPQQKSKVFWRYNAACKQMIYSSFHLTEENMEAYVRSLNDFKPDAIDGFFSCMCDLASYIERKKLCLKFKPVAIFPTSETLTETGRELLERVFKCRVYNQYASSEGAPFVTECANQVLHMEMASGVIENIDEDNSEVLVTSFTTHGTPLIRYRIGDRMAFSGIHECSCGMCSQIVEDIQGRKLDYLYTSKGAKVNSGNVANILKNLPNAVINAQFIQDAVNKMTVLLKVDPRVYDEKCERVLISEIVHKFGVDMEIDIRVVDEIPREKSGKFKMIINKVV